MRRQERTTATGHQPYLPNQFDRSSLPTSAPYSEHHFRNPFYPPYASHQGPPDISNTAAYASRNLPTFTPEPCPCCPIRSNRFQLADTDFPPNHGENMPSRLHHLAESSAFMEEYPRLHTNQSSKMSDERQRVRDYLLHGLVGMRECCNDESCK